MSAFDPKLKERLGRVLMHWRRDHDLTLVEVARRAGLSVSTIKNAEQGRVCPAVDTLHAWCGAMGAPTADVLKVALEEDS